MTLRCGCRKVRARDWHQKEHSFKDRSFYTRRIPLFFHVTIGLKKKIQSLVDEVEMKEYMQVEPRIILQKDGSLSGQVMVEIEKPRFFDPQIYTFDGDYVYTLVSEEPWNHLQSITADGRRFCEQQGHPIRNVYYWYTTCPSCKDFEGYQTVIIFEG